MIKGYAVTEPKGTLQPFEFDPGPLGDNQVEIKVEYCGLCHSDLSMVDNDWGISQYPLVPGHEIIGTVAALGPNAKGLKIGQRVGLGWFADSCLTCEWCKSGNHHLCPFAVGTIIGHPGGFADRVRANAVWGHTAARSAQPANRWTPHVRRHNRVQSAAVGAGPAHRPGGCHRHWGTWPYGLAICSCLGLRSHRFFQQPGEGG